MSDVLRRYFDRYSDVHGFFLKEAMAAWSFFLTAQNQIGPAFGSDFLEIGLLEGKSALLGAMFLRPEEHAVLIDLHPRDKAVALVCRERPADHVHFIRAPSYDGLRDPLITSRQFRFIHIDGDHTGYNLTTDLLAAASLIHERGVICVDDFFNLAYPQLTAGVVRFLFDNPLSFKMVLCGANKAFIVRASAYRFYENLIRDQFLTHLANCGFKQTLRKSSYTHDFGCFSFYDGEPKLVGMDDDIRDIVF